MGAAGHGGMAAVDHAVAVQNGVITAEGTMKALKGWSYDSPRGKITIDPETRDIIQDSNVHKVVYKDGRMMIEVIDTFPQVKDPCKAYAIGKCK